MCFVQEKKCILVLPAAPIGSSVLALPSAPPVPTAAIIRKQSHLQVLLPTLKSCSPTLSSQQAVKEPQV